MDEREEAAARKHRIDAGLELEWPNTYTHADLAYCNAGDTCHEDGLKEGTPEYSNRFHEMIVATFNSLQDEYGDDGSELGYY